MIRLGVHVSISGGIYKAVERARTLGCTTMQIFSHNPRGWALKGLDDDEVYLFKNLREEAGIRPLYVHTSYLINLCTSNQELYRKSKETFLSEIERADFLGADYLITHLGSVGHFGERQGVKRVVEALMDVSEKMVRAIRKPPLKFAPTQVLLENTAGERGEIGYSFEQLSEILSRVQDEETEIGAVGGICFDTCHAFASGYDLSTTQGIEKVIKRLDKIIGLKFLKVIHLNDSKRPLGSRIDRHEDIGKGWIGMKGFRNILNHPELRDIPFILETPKKSEDDDIRNLNVVRRLSGLRTKG
jgi:deoxyribonuclease-4